VTSLCRFTHNLLWPRCCHRVREGGRRGRKQARRRDLRACLRPLCMISSDIIHTLTHSLTLTHTHINYRARYGDSKACPPQSSSTPHPACGPPCVPRQRRVVDSPGCVHAQARPTYATARPASQRHSACGAEVSARGGRKSAGRAAPRRGVAGQRPGRHFWHATRVSFPFFFNCV